MARAASELGPAKRRGRGAGEQLEEVPPTVPGGELEPRGPGRRLGAQDPALAPLRDLELGSTGVGGGLGAVVSAASGDPAPLAWPSRDGPGAPATASTGAGTGQASRQGRKSGTKRRTSQRLAEAAQAYVASYLAASESSGPGIVPAGGAATGSSTSFATDGVFQAPHHHRHGAAAGDCPDHTGSQGIGREFVMVLLLGFFSFLCLGGGPTRRESMAVYNSNSELHSLLYYL